jgi:hypothetical protein
MGTRYKNPKVIRNYWREAQRRHRIKNKAKEALPAKVETSLTCTIPEGKAHEGTKPD